MFSILIIIGFCAVIYWITKATAVPWYVALGMTFLYWVWESQAGGNIRVDLLFLYPVMFTVYLITFKPRFGYWSLPVALGLIVLNFIFAVWSYKIFGKNIG